MQVNALRRENADLNENLARAIATIDALNQALEEMRRSSEEHLAATTSKNLAEITRLNDTIRNHQQTRDQLELDLQSQLFQVQRLRAQVAEKDGLERRCKDYQVKVDELEYRDARNALEISKLRGFVPEANAGASTVASLRAENEALQKRNESLTMQLATARTQYDALMGQLQFASGTATGK
jgi:chromosome segregation ATPase